MSRRPLAAPALRAAAASLSRRGADGPVPDAGALRLSPEAPRRGGARPSACRRAGLADPVLRGGELGAP